MDISLLRLATRNGSTRTWIVPGTPHAFKVSHANPRDLWLGQSATAFWPWKRPGQDTWEVRGVRLDWHHSIARQAAREFTEVCKK